MCVQDTCSRFARRTFGQLRGGPRQTDRPRTLADVAAHAGPGEDGDSYVTPCCAARRERTELVVLGGQILDAYDPLRGTRLWYLPGLVGSRTITGPLAALDMIYFTQGMKHPMLAVKPGGDGLRSRKDVVWKLEQGTADSPTPVVCGPCLYIINNEGIARCLDVHTGRRALAGAAEGRLPGVAAGRGRADLLPQHGRRVHGGFGLHAFRPSHRKSPGRRNAFFPGHFRRPALYSRPEIIILCREVNSKNEYRISKYETNSKGGNTNVRNGVDVLVLDIARLNFLLVSDFDIRISYFSPHGGFACSEPILSAMKIASPV